ncbi:adventurous-gliding motility protein Z-like isoform X3 [Penaeus monodon]|uniref:adventurous-gliding motility protein Z-like isoform X3 n=1 Tax=Penaeus monodon TaxID=6687 RepID=UPI0018A6E95E|nr:adventurous-gliding motility protein Z-like isoform X3 [Penaeus monodon]
MDPPKCEGRRDMSGGRKGNSDGGDDHGSSVGGGGGGGNNNNNNGTEGGNKSSSQMLGLLDEFTKIYSDRLQRVEQASMKTDNACYLQNKVCVLEAWVRDLGEQNAVLVATVEELEREAGERVALLEDRLTKMATTTRDSCLSLRDHQIQVSSLVADKMGLEKEAHELGEKVVGLERKTLSLKEENNNLQNDLNNLVQVITRARLTGQWEADNLTFSCVTPEQVFGPVLSSSRRSSQSLKESQHDYIQHMLEEHLRKDSSSLRSSLSNLQDGDSSMYGGRGSEKEMVIMKLRSDLRSLQSAQDETNQQLLERDKQIADLQMQLTELHHELALSQAEVNSVNHTLQEVRHRSRHETVEITRKEEVVRQLLSKQTKKDSVRGSYTSLCDLDSVITGDNNVESQLSENIDILAGRLAELEEECTQLREAHTALKDTHALCAPTISMLQDQLARSHQNQVELRTVLTAEVAERHDQLVALRDKLKEEEQRHHETKMQLQLKTEVVKDLRKEVRECKERPLANSGKEVNHMDKGTREGPAVNGFCSQSSQVSKLENELAEKSVLLRELQSHLAASRQELHLKDETLSKLEKKLDSVRREGGHNGERMQYLTGQLTSLQLEVGRTHGQAEHLRRQVEKKSELIQKMEAENTSLSQQLNDKSLTLERFQSEVLKMSTELEKKKKEIGEQRLTISSLQEALVTSKRTCDDLRSRLDNDIFELCDDLCKLQLEVSVRDGEAERLQRDLKEAQTLHHHTFTQLVEAGARAEVLQEENRVLSRRVTSLLEDVDAWRGRAEEGSKDLNQAQKECERVKGERDQLQRQLQEGDRRRQELLSSLQLLQGQVQTLEEEVTVATESRTEAERRASETQRDNLALHDRLAAQETSGSVERLGRQLEDAVAALTSARQEAAARAEQVRRSRQEVEQLNETLSYEKQLNASLHDQVEGLVKEAGALDVKVADHQQEIRRLNRELHQKERQMASLQTQLDGARSQLASVEELLEKKAGENQLLQETRAQLNAARREAARAEEQASSSKKELQDAKEKISRLERHARETEEDREKEVAALAERLTSAHEDSVRRLEDTLLTYTRVQAHDELQVESLEEALAEVGGRLGQCEVQLRESERERDGLARSLQHEITRRETEGQEHHAQVARLTQETALLRARLESVKEETLTWQRQCEDLEERQSLATDPLAARDQLASTLHQMDNLRAALSAARAEARAAEEEKSLAHEQVLSLIRECNRLEEKIEGMTKQKIRLEEEQSSLKKELEISRSTPVPTKDPEKEREESLLKEEVAMLKEQLEATKKQLKEATEADGSQLGQMESQLGEQQLRAELATARRDVGELRRLLLERESEARLNMLKVTTLQRTLQDRQHEVSGLEEKLQEAHADAHKYEVEAEEQRARAASLTTQIAHAHATGHGAAHARPQTQEVEALEDEVSRLKGELAAKAEELKQAGERAEREEAKMKDMQQDVCRLTRARDDAMRKAASLEASLGESEAVVEAARAVERVWGSQLQAIEEEVSRLACENDQLKECNADLHRQSSEAQQEGEQLRASLRSRESQLQELQQARDLLANDAQVVVAAVKQWLHEQKTTNLKMAGKLHQTNKQVLLLNTEKQFLAERNTSLQRLNHDLTLQLHDLRARLGLALAPSPSERPGKVGGVLVGGLSSPRVISPVVGVASPRLPSATPSLDSVLGFGNHADCKPEDGLSTCSSGSSSSSSGCQVPGPDLPGSFHLDRLASLADSLLVASRNISRSSGFESGSCHGKVTSATSLTDLVTLASPGHARSSLHHGKKFSCSTGNLSSLCPGPAASPTSIYAPYRVSDISSLLASPGPKVMMAGRGAEVILGTPVRERRSSHQMFLTDSIEETEEETYSVQDLDVSRSWTPSRQAPEPSSGSQATQTSVHVSACTQTGSESTQVQTLQVFPGAATADQGESSA